MDISGHTVENIESTLLKIKNFSKNNPHKFASYMKCMKYCFYLWMNNC